jgi:hypothetical protein
MPLLFTLCLLGLLAVIRPPRPRAGSVAACVRLRTRLTASVGAIVLLWSFCAASRWACFMVIAGMALASIVDAICLGAAARAARRGRTGIDFGLGRDWTRTALATDPYREQERVEIVARGNPWAAGGAIVWAFFVRVLVVLLPIVWITTAISPVCTESRIGRARTMLDTVRQATMQYKAVYGDRACPTVEKLIASGDLDAGFRARDPWGGVIQIVCVDDEILARSAGPDRRWGTDDDMTAPQDDRRPE